MNPFASQVAEQFDHRRVGALQIAATEGRMLRAAQERVRLRLEVLDADAGVGGQDAAAQRPHVGVVARVVLGHERAEPGVVALVGGLPRLALAQLRVRLRHLDEAAKDEVELDRHRLLAPQRAVVVEHRDPLLDRHGCRSVAARATKSTIACLAAPSRQLGSSAPIAR